MSPAAQNRLAGCIVTGVAIALAVISVIVLLTPFIHF